MMKFSKIIMAPLLGFILSLSLLTTGAFAQQSHTRPYLQSHWMILNAHNQERARVLVPALRWDATLESGALMWAQHLAAIHQMQHSNSGFGENLWWGTKGYYSDSEKVGFWLAEKSYFLAHRRFSDVSNTGRWQDVGHYTQVIWYNTRAIGCGMASDTNNDYLVCRYSPQGNIIGQFPLGSWLAPHPIIMRCPWCK